MVPKAVEAWRSELTSKGRKKLAEAVASPDVNAELFTEGWAEVLEKEKTTRAEYESVLVNGAHRA